MADRDIEIGRLQASVESLRNQNADQFKRIDALEVDVAQTTTLLDALKARVDAIAAPQSPRRFPDWIYDRKTWAALLAVLGLSAGWWNIDDLKSWLTLGTPSP